MYSPPIFFSFLLFYFPSFDSLLAANRLTLLSKFCFFLWSIFGLPRLRLIFIFLHACMHASLNMSRFYTVFAYVTRQRQFGFTSTRRLPISMFVNFLMLLLISNINYSSMIIIISHLYYIYYY